ncbi:uncharacterized protein LOC122794188 [Protopterus annectens]|uniref:uncharacterized protein LOC122794188 n=1 Tax=Protopterus annectens TaxID=7888 RepID=UPI001CFAA082|nr:uncharacterized protein LOC122794188 [Protopterus annectens]XP_043918337.1 uncharacterized protein LOC122794188 [Protopterus annectens]
MSERFKDILSESKDALVTVMEAFLDEPSIMVCAVGMVFPIVELAIPFIKLVLCNEESSEVKYMKEQFQMVRDQLEDVADQIADINKALKKKDIDTEFFKIEENLLFLFEKYMDIIDSKPKFQEGKKVQFVEDYEAFPADKDLHELYEAVMGNTAFGSSILDFAMEYTEKHRRALEKYFARLLKLFYLGLVIVIGYKAIKEENSEKFKMQWKEKMHDVETKMKSLIDECIDKFPEQARIDILKECLRQEGGKSNCELAALILGAVKEKYDWVSWSVQVFDQQQSSKFTILPKKGEYHAHSEKNSLDFDDFSKRHVVVSYSSDPKPVDAARIQHFINELVVSDTKCEMSRAVAFIAHNLPGHVIHIVKESKKFECSHNFPKDSHFLGVYQKSQICVHSE